MGIYKEITVNDEILQQWGYKKLRIPYFDEVLKREQDFFKLQKNGQDVASVDIPETYNYNGENYTITKIGEEAFFECRNIVNITLPNSITDIGKKAFLGCELLENINIPSGVTNIGEYAFACCKSRELLGYK